MSRHGKFSRASLTVGFLAVARGLNFSNSRYNTFFGRCELVEEKSPKTTTTCNRVENRTLTFSPKSKLRIHTTVTHSVHDLP